MAPRRKSSPDESERASMLGRQKRGWGEYLAGGGLGSAGFSHSDLEHLQQQRTRQQQASGGQGGFVALEVGGPSPGDAAGVPARRCPEEQANWLSRLAYLYVDPLMKAGAQHHLEPEDLWDMAQQDAAHTVCTRFNTKLRSTAQRTAPQGVVWRALWRTHGHTLVWTGVLKLVHDLIMFSPPFLLEQLLHHMAAGGSRRGAFGWACLMLGAALAENMTINVYFHALFRMSLHIKTALIQMIYDKSLRITSSIKSEMGVGAIMNLQSNDAAKIWGTPMYVHIIWNGPFQILVVMGMLVRLMGWAPALAGLLVTLIMIPTTTLVGKALARVRREMVKQTDARVKLASEIIMGIKAIKLYAWEDAYMERISALRDTELRAIRVTQLLSMLNMAVYSSGPVLVALAAFCVYAWLNPNSLSAAVAFPALSLFNLLRFPIVMFPSQVMNMIHARVGLQRIQAFMQAEEMVVRPLQDQDPHTGCTPARQPDNPFAIVQIAGEGPPASGHVRIQEVEDDHAPLLATRPPSQQPAAPAATSHAPHRLAATSSASQDSAGPDRAGQDDSSRCQGQAQAPAGVEEAGDAALAIDLAQGRFSWEAGKEEVLRGVDLAVEQGQLVMVVGQVGSGKSSLLQALLGEMHRVGGRVSVVGSIAYTAQDPWIQNTTLRKNVMMGKEYDDDLYTDVLAACALGPDLEMLAAGDATEIGEKGVNLSGGQKHRVALARAAYADADVYLLDDPLSAVDAHVGRILFDDCICGLLAARTRVLVTHQLQYLPAADVVVVMSEGQVKEQGSYQELLDRGVDLNQFIRKSESQGGAEREAKGPAATSPQQPAHKASTQPDDPQATATAAATGAGRTPGSQSPLSPRLSDADIIKQRAGDVPPLINLDSFRLGCDSPGSNGPGSPALINLDSEPLGGQPLQQQQPQPQVQEPPSSQQQALQQAVAALTLDKEHQGGQGTHQASLPLTRDTGSVLVDLTSERLQLQQLEQPPPDPAEAGPGGGEVPAQGPGSFVARAAQPGAMICASETQGLGSEQVVGQSEVTHLMMGAVLAAGAQSEVTHLMMGANLGGDAAGIGSGGADGAGSAAAASPARDRPLARFSVPAVWEQGQKPLVSVQSDRAGGLTPTDSERALLSARSERSEKAVMRREQSRRNLLAMRMSLRRTMQQKEQDGKIIKVEERAVGQVDRAIYRAYLHAWGEVWVLLPLAVVTLAFAERGLQVGQNYVLSFWTNDTTRAAQEGGTPRTQFWLLLYFGLGMLSIVMQLVRAWGLIAGSISASRTLHAGLLHKVVRLPMAFFDSQPTGRLLNRMTKDTEAVDVQVSGSVNSALNCLVNAVLSLLVVAAVTPAALLALLPLSYFYYAVQVLYISSSRELKRLDSLAFSPIFQHFGESLHGLATIRAFAKQQLFVEKNKANLDASNRAYWPIQVVNRWLSVRIELMGATVVFATAVCVAVLVPASPGLVGLALTSALNLTGILGWMVRQMTELEVNMNSVERLVEYNKYEEEAPGVVPEQRPPPGWPHAGAIEVRDLSVRYRPELEPVLRNLSFSVRAREKIGVCGRTGCGKSTLMITLYRLIEPCGGTILIDGVDIRQIGLKDLRSRLSLVPQDPVIFSGTIRSNLDPFGTLQQQHGSSSGDDAVWGALRRAGMEEYVRGQEGGLDAAIKEGGANLSVGQRQLLCMARALLRASRILVLDEATSNVDNATDSVIQATIRSAFADCTVLTIAHRLHTIIDSDRVLLLDSGLLLEFDTPAALLQNPGSSFRRLVEETTKGGGLNADAVAAALQQAVAAGAAEVQSPSVSQPATQ